MVAPTGVVRIVATADNHLNRFYARMTPQKLAQRRKYLRDGFKAAVDYAVAWPAHLFLIAGDLFDQPDPRNVDRAFVAHCLVLLRDAGVRVYAVGGNHDTPRQSTEQGGRTPLEVYHRLGGMTCFDSSSQIDTDVVEIEGLRVAIGGMTADPAAPARSDPLEGITWDARPAEANLGIVLLHAQVEGYEVPDSREPVVTIASLNALEGVDLFVVGDIHRPAMRRLGDGKRMLVIPGATERMTFGEDPGVPGFVSVEMGRGEVLEYQRIRLTGQLRAEITVRPSEIDAGNPLDDLKARVAAVSTPDTMVKLRLEGVLSRELYHSLELRQLYEAISTQAFHFTVDTGGLLVEDERHETAERGVRFSQQEELTQFGEELADSSGDGEEREYIEEAVQRLLARY